MYRNIFQKEKEYLLVSAISFPQKHNILKKISLACGRYSQCTVQGSNWASNYAICNLAVNISDNYIRM